MVTLPGNKYHFQLLLTNLLSMIVSLWSSIYRSLLHVMKSYHLFTWAPKQYYLSLPTVRKLFEIIRLFFLHMGWRLYCTRVQSFPMVPMILLRHLLSMN